MSVKIKNKELAKRISYALNMSNYSDIFFEEDLARITNMSFPKMREDGEDTKIGLDNMFLFNNLKYATFRDFTLTESDLRLIAEKKSLEGITFDRCFFDNVDFNKVEGLPDALSFTICLNLPERFPSIPEVDIRSCLVDFNSIDFSNAKKIRIILSKITNAHDLDEYSNIEEIDLDGSKLINKNGVVLENIAVGKGCFYTHNEINMFERDETYNDYDDEREI